VERLRASLEAFLAGTSESDREAILTKFAELWDPDIEMDSTENSTLGVSGVYRGKDAVRQVWREWLGAWENLRFEYKLVDAGERVLMLCPREVLHEPGGSSRSGRAIGRRPHYFLIT
jgi:hypothetical protein